MRRAVLKDFSRSSSLSGRSHRRAHAQKMRATARTPHLHSHQHVTHAHTRGSHSHDAPKPYNRAPQAAAPTTCPLNIRSSPQKRVSKKASSRPLSNPPLIRLVGGANGLLSPMVQGASHTHTHRTRRVWEGGLLHAPFHTRPW